MVAWGIVLPKTRMVPSLHLELTSAVNKGVSHYGRDAGASDST